MMGSHLNILDALVLLIIFLSAITAFVKGLTVEIFSLLSTVVGFLLAVLFYGEAGDFFRHLGLSLATANFIGFLTLLLGVSFLGAALARLLDTALRAIHLKWIDQVLGALFGLFRGGLVAAILFLALAAFQVQKDLVLESRLANPFLEGARIIAFWTPESFKRQFYEGYEKIYQLWSEQAESWQH